MSQSMISSLPGAAATGVLSTGNTASGNAIGLYARPSANFAAKLERSKALLREAERDYSPLTQASSLGVEDMVVTELIHQTGIQTRIFVLETGMLHAETVALLDTLQKHYGREVDVYRPVDTDAEAFVANNGPEAMYQSLALRKECCDIRKTRPLALALAGKKGWLTGLRREQSNARAEVSEIEQQPARAKINPIVDWTWGDVWHFVQQHNIPTNPLHDQFMPSIGCAPCTRAIAVGEDFRAGRWWWEDSSKECGLHVDGGKPKIIPIKESA